MHAVLTYMCGKTELGLLRVERDEEFESPLLSLDKDPKPLRLQTHIFVLNVFDFAVAQTAAKC